MRETERFSSQGNAVDVMPVSSLVRWLVRSCVKMKTKLPRDFPFTSFFRTIVSHAAATTLLLVIVYVCVLCMLSAVHTHTHLHTHGRVHTKCFYFPIFSIPLCILLAYYYVPMTSKPFPRVLRKRVAKWDEIVFTVVVDDDDDETHGKTERIQTNKNNE